jgi:hypothetical protein
VFGFASTAKTVEGNDVKAGEFVKAMTGASVKPFRCCLTYSGTDESLLQARGLARGEGEALPDRIAVRLISKDGETVGIQSIYADGDYKSLSQDSGIANSLERSGWWTLDGRRLDGEPGAKGIYIHNGRKVVKR